MGELGLDASVREIPGALPIAEYALASGMDGCILPEESAAEAAELTGIKVYGVRNLADVLKILGGKEDVSDLLISERVTPPPVIESMILWIFGNRRTGGREEGCRNSGCRRAQSDYGRAAGIR